MEGELKLIHQRLDSIEKDNIRRDGKLDACWQFITEFKISNAAHVNNQTENFKVIREKQEGNARFITEKQDKLYEAISKLKDDLFEHKINVEKEKVSEVVDVSKDRRTESRWWVHAVITTILGIIVPLIMFALKGYK